MIRLSFHGAAETVTGSKYLLEVDDEQVLIDCGMFQGLKELRLKNWEPLPIDAARVQSIVLTHSHIDHIGMLPRFFRQGYTGPIFCTPATEDLAELLLFDAAKNQEADAEYANRRGFSKHHPALPLFDSRDVAKVLKQFRAVRYNAWHAASDSIWFRYHDAGHLLGSSWVEIEVRRGPRPLRIVFSGDIGRYEAPLYHDPSPPVECDYLVCESTYGNRDHTTQPALDALADVVNTGIRRGGIMLVPSFAVGRAQQLIYLLEVLISRERIPELPIYLDSPMAINATSIFQQYRHNHDLTESELAGPDHAFSGRNIHLTRTADESKGINRVEGPAIVISSSGMMIGGRILHHLKRRLPEPQNTIVLGGFMAAGTRGRALQDGATKLRIHGQDVPVRAAVVELSGLSAHAGRSELLRWLSPLPAPRRTFLTHGELSSATALAAELKDTRGWTTCVPKLGEQVELELPA